MLIEVGCVCEGSIQKIKIKVQNLGHLKQGRDFSRDPGIQEIIKTHRKSLLELPVLTFQVELFLVSCQKE